MKATPHSTHSVEAKTFQGLAIGSLLTVDYNEVPLSVVPYSFIATAGEDPDYRWELKERIERERIRVPAVIAQRGLAGPLRLVDGHHRARLALDLGLELPAVVHTCSCAASELDYFGLCDKVLATVKELKESSHEPKR